MVPGSASDVLRHNSYNLPQTRRSCRSAIALEQELAVGVLLYCACPLGDVHFFTSRSQFSGTIFKAQLCFLLVDRALTGLAAFFIVHFSSGFRCQESGQDDFTLHALWPSLDVVLF